MVQEMIILFCLMMNLYVLGFKELQRGIEIIENMLYVCFVNIYYSRNIKIELIINEIFMNLFLMKLLVL